MANLLREMRLAAMRSSLTSPRNLVLQDPDAWDRIASIKDPAITAELIESWEFNARHSQLPPEGEWKIWALITGRGFGKNWVMSKWLHREVAKYPGKTFFIAGRTKEDVRKTTVQSSESGILTLQDPDNPCEYQHHLSQVKWANGSIAHLLTSEEPDGCRGPGYAGGIVDELAAWKTKQDNKGNSLLTNIRFATRAKLGRGNRARIVIGTTPKPTAEIRKLIEDGNSASPRVALTTGTMHENAENLGEGFIEEIESEYAGTWLWDQEALGKLLMRVRGAILSPEMLNDGRVDEAPEITRICIGVDPAAKSKSTSDLSGINVSGIGTDGHLYSLKNLSFRGTPNEVGRAVVDAYWKYGDLAEGNAIIALEDNQGGEWLSAVLRGIDSRPRIRTKTATRSKSARATAVLAYYERGEAHIVGNQRALETQLCGFTQDGRWEGEGSPDDADAHVWAGRELMIGGRRSSIDDMIRMNA